MYPINPKAIWKRRGITTPYIRWIRDNIKKLGFLLDIDYIVLSPASPQSLSSSSPASPQSLSSSSPASPQSLSVSPIYRVSTRMADRLHSHLPHHTWSDRENNSVDNNLNWSGVGEYCEGCCGHSPCNFHREGGTYHIRCIYGDPVTQRERDIVNAFRRKCVKNRLT